MSFQADPGGGAGGAASLLAAMDMALCIEAAHAASGDPATDRRDAGVAAAARLNDLLIRHRLSWDDVLAPGSRLAKLCGRLGSGYAAEREAAYAHAVRLILRRRATWSELVRLPRLPRGLAGDATAAPEMVPPEADWMTTVRHLRAGSAWRSAAERVRLAALEDSLAHGGPPHARDAAWLRELWWRAELNDPSPEDSRG